MDERPGDDARQIEQEKIHLLPLNLADLLEHKFGSNSNYRGRDFHAACAAQDTALEISTDL